MKIHMVGIGGIGMSALAQLYAHDGHAVTGSDREASPTTELLEKKGVHVLIGQHAENVPADAALVVYSDAVPAENPERAEAARRSVRQISYFRALGEVSAGKRTIAVSGTHGKTTTTGMLAKLLIDMGESPTTIVGSIVRDFGSNYVAGTSDLFVVEACEYRDHLLELSPEMLIITNLEWDHTDFFPSLAALQDSFKKAVEKIPAHGAIVTNPSNPNIAPILAGAKARILDYTKEPARALKLPGEFNEDNARAAAAAARVVHPDVSEEALLRSLGSFSGTWRRFDIKGAAPGGSIVIDDYAHHPTAIAVTLTAAREKYPGKTLVVAFHPHLYTRTRDLMDEFRDALSKADRVLIAPIYAAREEPIPGVTAEALAARVQSLGRDAEAFDSLDAVEARLRELSSPGTLIITMGAGDIYKVAGRLVS